MLEELTWDEIIKNLSKTYDNIIQDYAKKSKNRQPIERLNEFIKYLPDVKGQVVDLGCGVGRDVNYFAKRGFFAYGIDISNGMITLAKETYPPLDFKIVDMSCTKFPKLIGVWASSSVQHLRKDRLQQMLKNIYNGLVKGGIFYANFRYGNGEEFKKSGEYKKSVLRFFAYYIEEEFNSILENVGFKIIRSETYNPGYNGVKSKDVSLKVRVYAKRE